MLVVVPFIAFAVWAGVTLDEVKKAKQPQSLPAWQTTVTKAGK